MKKIHIGNLPFSATEANVRTLFAQYGTVHSVELITDRNTGESRGFAFVKMEEDEAKVAMTTLNGTELGGRRLKVNEARPQQ